MAREHARLLVRINTDREFAELDPLAQWLFCRLTARQELNYAGVLQLDTKRWARMSKHVTVAEVEKAVATLRSERYLIVDDETDEVLIRSLVRNDEVAKQPNVLKSALRAAEFVESEAIRSELAVELRRVRAMAREWQRPEVDRTVGLLDPSAKGSPEGSGNPTENPLTDPVGNPSANPGSPPTENPSSDGLGEVEVVGEVEGESPPEGKSLGGSRASAREAAPAHDPSASGGPPAPTSPSTTNDDWPSQPCGRSHDPDRDCRRCGTARASAERDAGQQRRDTAAAVRACQMCDVDGWLFEVGRRVPVTPYARCDHHTDQRQQVADARDEAS